MGGDGYADGHLVYNEWKCPGCGTYYKMDGEDYNYCPNCGQRIDWSEFEKWKDGKILFDAWKEEFVDNVNLTDDQKEYARKEYESKKNDFSKDWEDLSDSAKEKCYEKYIKEHNLIDEEYKTYNEYMNDYELESFFDTYTTKNGEKVVAFGKYGYC